MFRTNLYLELSETLLASLSAMAGKFVSALCSLWLYLVIYIFTTNLTACLRAEASLKSVIGVHKSHKNIEHRLKNNDF